MMSDQSSNLMRNFNNHIGSSLFPNRDKSHSALKNNNVLIREKLHNALKNNNVLMIGNGFDLALGKLTSYQDFLLYLFLLKLCLWVNGDNLQGPLDKCDVIYESCNSLDNKIKCVVEIVRIEIESIKSNKEVLGSLCNFIYERESFLDLFSRVIFQSQFHDVKEVTEQIKDMTNEDNIGWSYSEFLFYKHKISRISNDNQFTENFRSNIINCIEEFYNLLCPKKMDKSPIYLNGWLDVESLIQFVVMPNELLNKRFLREPIARNCIEDIIKRLDIALDIENSEKLFNSLQSFTDHFCEFLSLQEDTKLPDCVSVHLSIFENYELSFCSENVGFRNIVGFIDVFLNSITSVVDFNYTLTSKHIFDDVHKKAEGGPSKFSIFHVNGSINLNYSGNNAIFGYTKTSPNLVNVNAFKFEKRSQRQLKDVNSPDFYTLTKNKYNLIIFGHSCSPADADVIRPLLLSPNLNVVVIFCYSQEDKLSIYKNLDEILGAENLDHLTRQTNDLENKLIWAVRKKH